ncbi:MAG: LysR family transcriptional regulator [Eubacterium sp.]|nr:LysR family transcriptional regulator [Eubacterium sp.]
MNTTQIRYFIEAAKEMNFTKAANKLYITQPALSLQIASLEKELGVKLFDRSKKNSLRLTHAGEVYKEIFMRHTLELEQAAERIAAEEGMQVGDVHVGVVEGVEIAPHITEFLDSWAQRYPNVKIIFENYPLQRLMPRLRSKKIDIMLHFERLLPKNRKTYEENLFNICYGSVLYSEKNPVAGKEDLKLSDFNGQPFYMLENDSLESIRESALYHCHSNDYYPELELLPNHDSILSAIKSGRGCFIFHPWSRYFDLKGYRKLDTTEKIPLYIVRRRQGANEAADIFYDEILEFIHKA